MSTRTTRSLSLVGAAAAALLLAAFVLGSTSRQQAQAAVPAGEVNPAKASEPIKTNVKAFKTPSGRLACQYTNDYATRRPIVQCEVRLIGGGDYPKVQGRSRPKDCDTDWGGVVEVHPSGKAQVPCAGGVMVPQKNPRTLAYGTRWARGSYICLSRRDALRCSTKSGAHGFKANRDVIRVW